MKRCLSFAGVAGNFPFHLGVASELSRLTPLTDWHYAGVSSGSVVASSLALGMTGEDGLRHFQRFTTFFQRWYQQPTTYWFQALRQLYTEIFPVDAYQRVSGRLYIGYTALTLKGLEARVVSDFTSNDDLIDAIFTSCRILPYAKCPVWSYRGELCTDGAFTCNTVKPAGYQTVVVTTAMVYQHCFLNDWLPSLDHDKLYRLYGTGRAFVVRHEDYWRQAVTTGQNRRLVLPSPVATAWWQRGRIVVIGLLLCWLWRRYRQWCQWCQWRRLRHGVALT
jgi:hypothetical protein